MSLQLMISLLALLPGVRCDPARDAIVLRFDLEFKKGHAACVPLPRCPEPTLDDQAVRLIADSLFRDVARVAGLPLGQVRTWGPFRTVLTLIGGGAATLAVIHDTGAPIFAATLGWGESGRTLAPAFSGVVESDGRAAPIGLAVSSLAVDSTFDYSHLDAATAWEAIRRLPLVQAFAGRSLDVGVALFPDATENGAGQLWRFVVVAPRTHCRATGG